MFHMWKLLWKKKYFGGVTNGKVPHNGTGVAMQHSKEFKLLRKLNCSADLNLDKVW